MTEFYVIEKGVDPYAENVVALRDFTRERQTFMAMQPGDSVVVPDNPSVRSIALREFRGRGLTATVRTVRDGALRVFCLARSSR